MILDYPGSARMGIFGIVVSFGYIREQAIRLVSIGFSLPIECASSYLPICFSSRPIRANAESTVESKPAVLITNTAATGSTRTNTILQLTASIPILHALGRRLDRRPPVDTLVARLRTVPAYSSSTKRGWAPEMLSIA